MSTFRNGLILLSTVSVVLFFPIILVAILFLAIWRQIVRLLALIFRPDFKGLVHHASAFWAADLDRPTPKANIGACLLLEGHVTLECLISSVSKSLVLERAGSSFAIPYSELGKFPVPFMGCSFWKDDLEFDLRAHITEDSTPYQESDLPRVTTAALSDVPWPKGRSPWRMILLSNLNLPGRGPAVGVILSFHHCLGDAEGIGQSFRLFNGKVSMSEPLPNVSVAQLLRLPYTVLDNYIWAYDTNALHLSAKLLSPNRFSAFLNERIPFGGMSFDKLPRCGIPDPTYRTAIILTGVAGGVRRFMMSKRIEPPKFLHFFQPLFLPRNGIKYKNCGSLEFHRLYTGTEDTMERLDKTVNFLQASKNSVMPWTYHMTYKVIGTMPRFMQKVIVQSWQATGVYTEDDFPEKHYTACAQKAPILEFHNFAGPMPGTSGIFVYVSIFKDEVGIRLSISESICSSENAVENILYDIVNEIKDIVHSFST